jgi:cellulose synthase operon protein C
MHRQASPDHQKDVVLSIIYRVPVLAACLLVAACSASTDPKDLVKQAQQAIAKGDTAAAQIHLKSALQAQPDNAAARAEMGLLALSQADFATAENDLRKALDAGLDAPRLLEPYLESLALQGRFETITSSLPMLEKLAPQAKPLALAYVGRGQMQQGKVTEAQQSFEKALAIEPNALKAQIGLTALMFGLQPNDVKARERLNALVGIHAKHPDVLALQAHVARLDTKVEQARDYLVQAVAARPYDTGLHISLIQASLDMKDLDTAQKQITASRRAIGNLPILAYFDAQVAYLQGRVAQARELIQSVVSRTPGFLQGLELAGDVSLLTNEPGLAERYAKRLIEAAPASLNGHRMLAKAYLAMGSPERALSGLEPLLKAKVQDPLVLALAGDAAMKTGDNKRAITLLDQAQALAKDAMSLKLASANARIAGGDRSQGLNQLDNALRQADVSTSGLSIASSYAAAGAWDKAGATVQRYIELRPNDPAGPQALGVLLAQQGKTEDAIRQWERAVSLDAGFMPAVIALAQSDMARNQVANAKQRYQQVLQTQPKNGAALLALARLTAATGGPEAETVKWFNAAREASGNAAAPTAALAMHWVQTNQSDLAVSLLEPLLQSPTADPALISAAVNTFMARNDPAKALALLEKQLQGNSTSGALFLQIGQVRTALNDANGALSSFQKAAELQPGALEPRIALTSALFNAKQPEDAVKVARSIQQDQPSNPVGWILESDLMFAQSKPGDALALARKAFAIAPGAPPSMLKLHRLLYVNGQDNEARNLVRKWWSSNPRDPQVLLNAADAMIERKDWREAFGALNEVIKLMPNSPAALNNAAVVMQELKEPKAILLAQRAYQLDPNNASVMDTYGWLLTDQGQTEKGLPLLKAAVAKAPKRGDIRLHLAQALAKAGQKQEASLQAKAALDAGLPDAQKAIAQQLL